MHILLTDVLSCPRCGPEYGLVLLAERIENRRVLQGWLGCSKCEERYRIEGGFADLRVPPAEALPGVDTAPQPGGHEEALRLTALLGVTRGAGFALVVGPAARLAPGVAGLVEGLEVVAADAALAGWVEEVGVSRLAVAQRLPFYSGRLRAVALSGEAADALLAEGARVLGPLGRLVLLGASPDAAARLTGAGLELIAAEGDTVVAARG